MKLSKLFDYYVNPSFAVVCLLMLLCCNSFAERTTTYLHSDMLGSTVAATNENGDLIWRKNYQPYGTSFTYDKAGDDSEQDIVDYTSHSKDLDMEITYMGARWYDPEIGRFLSMDPVGVQQSVTANPAMFNRYAYANNNPYKFIDPDGGEAIDASIINSMKADARKKLPFTISLSKFHPTGNGVQTDGKGGLRIAIGSKGLFLTDDGRESIEVHETKHLIDVMNRATNLDIIKDAPEGLFVGIVEPKQRYIAEYVAHEMTIDFLLSRMADKSKYSPSRYIESFYVPALESDRDDYLRWYGNLIRAEREKGLEQNK